MSADARLLARAVARELANTRPPAPPAPPVTPAMPQKPEADVFAAILSIFKSHKAEISALRAKLDAVEQRLNTALPLGRRVSFTRGPDGKIDGAVADLG